MHKSSNDRPHGVLRSGYDIDGTRVELLYDQPRDRYTVATRWAHLKHFPVPFRKEKWTRIMLDRASAVFEAVCLHGASKEVARVAAGHATRCDRVHFQSNAAYEREILRKTRSAFENKSST